MTDVALVIFKDTSKTQSLKKTGILKSLVLKITVKISELLFKRGFFKTYFGARLFCYSKRKELRQPNSVIEISGQLRLQLIKLPVSQNRLSDINSSILEKVINENTAKNTTSFCYVPAFIKDKGFLGTFEKCPCNDKLLLKFMFAKALNDLYSKNSRRIGDMDIVITAGDNVSEALTLVRLMEAQIRYVTIAVTQKETAEIEAENIFGDMGLSISIVSDCRSALKNADLIINLADRSFIPPRLKTRAAALVFNLGNDDISRCFPENAIVNGLVPDLPQNDAVNLDKDILKYYSRREISELVITLLMELTRDSIFDFENSRRTRQEFEKYGFRTIGFTGRHGVLKIDALQKLATSSS